MADRFALFIDFASWPSTKERGEKYICEWECKGSFGKEGICKQSFKESTLKFLFVSVFLILLLGIIYLTLKQK